MYPSLRASRDAPRRSIRSGCSFTLREPRARDDEGLDGGARELGEHERRTVHRTVVIPKRLQLRTLCACRDEGLKRTWERSEDVSPAFRAPRDDGKTGKTKPFRVPFPFRSRPSSEAFAKIKLVRERRLFSNFIDILVRHGTKRGRERKAERR